MKTDEVLATITEEDEFEDNEVEWEDFVEAVDLLASCLKQIDHVIRYGISDGRRHLLQNLCDDINQFVQGYEVEEP